MTGMHARSGRALDSRAHLQQSVQDILTTPLGSRVMRRDYGSLLPEMIDQPLNDATLLQCYSAAIIALLRWEPRLRLSRIQRRVSSSGSGRAVFAIEGQSADGEAFEMEASL